MQNAMIAAQANHPDDPSNPQGIEAQLRGSIGELIEQAKTIKIFTRADLSFATDLLKTIKDRGKAAEDERKRLVKPFNEGVAQINGRFKSLTLPLQEIEQFLKGKMLDFQRAEERKAEEERRKQKADRQKREKEEREALAAEEARRLQEATDGEEQDRAEPPPPALTEPPAPIQSTFKPTTYGQTGATSTMKKVWKSELVDIALVPKEYLLLDQVKVNQAVRAGFRDIPGVRIFQTEELAVK